jgi:DNA (cytosine-5)-methyltransferase 1
MTLTLHHGDAREGGRMSYLSLFSGAGGGDLGLQQLLGWRCLGYVEIEAYCQQVLRARQRDGVLQAAPIFGDLRAFLREGYARSYQGMVDLVAGGFPCQPFSVAGRRRGADDARNLWPETAATLGEVGSRYAFLENVPGLVSAGYFGTILADLAALGYDAEWTVLGAADVGAPHRRERLWILADADYRSRRPERRGKPEGRPQLLDDCGADGATVVADAAGLRPQARTDGAGLREQPSAVRTGDATGGRESWWNCDPAEMGDANRVDCRGRDTTGQQGQTGFALGSADGFRDSDLSGAEGAGTDGRVGAQCSGEEPPPSEGDAQPGLGGVADGLAGGVDFPDPTGCGRVPRVATGIQHRIPRLKAIGNGQVPTCAATAFRLLYARLREAL